MYLFYFSGIGVCKFQESWKVQFPWVVGNPNDVHKAKCIKCSSVLNIKSGSDSLRKHQLTESHMSNDSSLQNQPDIAKMLLKATSNETNKKRALILQCLRVVLDGYSLPSSDSSSRKRKLYSKMFPDSRLADIGCGRTKAGYVLRFALAPYVKDELMKCFSISTPFAIHVDEATYHGKVRLEYWVIFFNQNERHVRYLTTKELQTDINVESFLNDDLKSTNLKNLKLVTRIVRCDL